MSDNGNNSSKNDTLNVGEISTIRDILMGQQMSEYDLRFKALEERMMEMMDTLDTQINDNNNQAIDQRNRMEKSLTDQLNNLDKAIGKRLEALENKLQQTSTKDKARIGKMLADMGKKLMEG